MVNIGKIIYKIQKKRKISVIDLAKLINTTRNNIYHIHSRKTIDTGLLYKLCIILDYNFFSHYIPEVENESVSNKNNDTYSNKSQIIELESKINHLENDVNLLKEHLNDKEMIIKLLKQNINK